jgi:purine-cytosine permease-like protein
MRDNLRRLRLFVWFIGVLGALQAVGALFAASSVDPATAGVQIAVAVGVALVGASTVAARSRFLRRPWRTEDEHAVVVDYSVRLIVQLVLALGAANVAYAGSILTGAAWMTVLGLVFFLPPLVAAAPSARNLGRVQRELTDAGCSFDLVEALRAGDTV